MAKAPKKKKASTRKVSGGANKHAKGQAAVGGFIQGEGTRQHRKIRQGVGR